jgi:AcrR family transcriptional regulator
MSKKNSELTWIEAGYNQFAAEGLEGIQVERLARITGLNKSGYYHYFGDRETYLEKLMDHHLQLAINYTNELKQVRQFDPEFIELLIKYKTQLMFASQLVRNRHEKLLMRTHERTNEMVDPVLSKLFADFIGFKDHLEFSTRYYNQVRYMYHAQITPDRINYPFLRDFMYEAKELIQRAVELAATDGFQKNI